ncbi:MAG: hypothetical protein ACRCZB_03070 [Bacteroidales bacterium]
MYERKSKVVLMCDTTEREFELCHAERLLRMPNNGGWHLPSDSEFELTEYGIKYRGNQRTASKTKTQKHNKQSSTSRE